MRELVRDCCPMDREAELAEHLGLRLILPVAIGAMTDSPIFALEGTTDLPDDDDYEVPTDDAPVWWWPSYMVHDLTETLRERGRAVLTSSENS